MGDKVRARAFVAARGFPVAPSAIEDDDPSSFHERARALDVPLLIKPAAGGGGKGMRIVRDLARLDDELIQARREGERYFGDGRLYVERYIEQPRHIEVQILGDQHGTVLHLHERECSLQRRFQKIIEEAPAPALRPDERAMICEAGVGIARAACYYNAGTVEFIYGAGDFYFLEMNTRLQVEHPVTELITSIDLVEQQLRVAAGERLGFSQGDIRQDGHAIEMRIYAEDADSSFAPATGPILRWRPPVGTGVRVDAGMSEGDEVTSLFDPMLAKLAVHGQDRPEALRRAKAALQATVLLGCVTNIAFLRRLINLPCMQAGDVNTGTISDHQKDLLRPEANDATLRAVIAAAALSSREVLEAADAVPPLHAAIGEWRN
jgi:propionyl-CoA carboxylase alpha chain/3-methylcrotonyl-CoA carboxylase alpha subunit/acetyl-CoA/propionyl-CoA carboxylase biotin carboxyl carrier protein